MNCDHAFDLMTDAAQDDCAALHAHLDECPRCRQMYATLAPALGLFAAADRSGERPPDGAETTATSVEIAERIAVRLGHSTIAAPQTLTSRPRRSRLLWACVLAGSLGFLSAVGVMSLPVTSPVPASSERCTWTHREAVPSGQRPAALVLSCVACHQAQRQQPSQASTTRWSFDGEQLLVDLRIVGEGELPMWIRLAVWPSDSLAHT